ncbi:hypothetical protein KR044_006324, partial [Drosophila immigrans]
MSPELIVISLMRTCKWINVLMPNSQYVARAKQRKIEVTSNGIRWTEEGFELFTPLFKFFKINSNPNEGLAMKKTMNDATVLKLSVRNINEEALEEQTTIVPIERLKLHLDESMTFGLQCSNCHNNLMAPRRFNFIIPFPIFTMDPRKLFCGNGNSAPILSDGELYYALNLIVISPRILGQGVIRNREQLHCRRCLQLLGESLGGQAAVKLYVDTLWVISQENRRLEQLFEQLSVTQLMFHLLHNAVPISQEQRRLFLKSVRPDGQLHYMLLLVNSHPLHLLRSNLSLSEMFSIDESDGLHSQSKRQRLTTKKPVHEVKVTGFRGCRINYQIFCNDEQLSDNCELFEKWLAEGTPMLRISHTMMMDLLQELKMNESLAAKVE